MTQPAVSQQLRVLNEARLVIHEPEGTRRHYRASTDGPADLRRYVESLWDDVLSGCAAGDPARAKTPAKPKRKRGSR